MINEDVHTIGMFADKAFDEGDIDTYTKLEKIVVKKEFRW